MRYRKVLVAALATIASAVLAAFMPDSTISATEWVNVGILAVGLIPTFYVANSASAPVAKTVVAAANAGLTLLASFVVDGVVTATEWSLVAAATIGVILVWAVPNGGVPLEGGGPRAAVA